MGIASSSYIVMAFGVSHLFRVLTEAISAPKLVKTGLNSINFDPFLRCHFSDSDTHHLDNMAASNVNLE